MNNIVVLSYDEKFITFLNPELLTLTRTDEIDGIRTISVEYSMETEQDAKTLFSIGNKIWVSTEANKGELYVINTHVKRDYFQENKVSFDAEDVIVELNYAPFFNQNDLTTANGFTLGTTNGEDNVKVDYKALKYWFGDYFNIGVVQDCLNSRIQKISPIGTMSKMELLRYIEEETSNRFITRYEKDTNTNVIHRYLDYLNPNSNDNNWEVNFTFIPINIEENLPDEILEIDPNDDPDDDNYPAYKPPTPHSISDLQISLKDRDGEVFEDLSWTATDLDIDTDDDRVDITIKYQKPKITVTIDNRKFDTTVTIDDPVYGDDIIDETLMTSVSDDTEVNDIIVPNGLSFVVEDTSTNDILYSHEINPVLGDVHIDVLDLGYNAENIEYTIDETDTYTAIAPSFTLAEDGNSSFTRKDLTTIINRWKNLEVNKGDTIPMIVQKVTITGTDSKPCVARNGSATSSTTTAAALLGTRSISSNYWLLPLHGNDNTEATNKSYEYWRATAYWTAPYNKRAGEMHVEIDDETGAEYTHIITRPDTDSRYGPSYRPKLGQISTTEEDYFLVYNAVAMALKDHKDPNIEVSVDVANYRNGEYNNYNLYDKVYVKIPGFERLVTAIVSKTNKNLHDIGENTVELTNFNVNTKVATKETVIYGDNVSFKYPKTSKLTIQLADITSENDVLLANKVVTFTLYRQDDSGSTTFRKAYNKKTDSTGQATLPLTLHPGNYIIEVNFGGDVEYSSSSASFEINVSGEVPKPKTSTSSAKNSTAQYTTKKRYWTKCGISPDKKQIVAIAQPSASNSDMQKYKVNYNTIYKTIFKNKCPYCGKNTLRYDDGRKNGCITNHGHRGNKREVPEGEITCHNCDSDFDGVTGLEKSNRHTGRLTMVKKPVKSSKSEKTKLIGGKLVYDTQKVKVKTKKVTKKASQTTLKSLNKKVKEKGQKLAKGKSNYQALKAIANFMGTIKYQKYANHHKTAKSVLSSRRGNCVDQAILFAELCDAAGLLNSKYHLDYVHVCCNHTSWPGVGHVFTRLTDQSTGKKVYVDPTCSTPYGHYTHGWGSPPGSTKRYPNGPL